MTNIKESCTIFYRTYSGENKAPRPSWYSKELCLKSMLLAVRTLEQQCHVKMFVLHDGPMNNNLEWVKNLRCLVEPQGEVRELPQMGNSQSCLYTISQATELPENEIIFLAEDDYLWLGSSLLEIVNALIGLPANYITGYDHPVRYQPDYPLGADCQHWYTTIHICGDRHWRSQESITMSFAARSGTLKEDLKFFERYRDNGKGSPDDRELFRDLQGLGSYSESGNHRLLMGPMPSLSTHAHLPWLAPVIDWEKEAKRTNESNELEELL